MIFQIRLSPPHKAVSHQDFLHSNFQRLSLLFLGTTALVTFKRTLARWCTQWSESLIKPNFLPIFSNQFQIFQYPKLVPFKNSYSIITVRTRCLKDWKSKGQIMSECILWNHRFSKIPPKNLIDFCPGRLYRLGMLVWVNMYCI